MRTGFRAPSARSGQPSSASIGAAPCGDLSLEDFTLICRPDAMPTLELVLTSQESRYRGLLPVRGREYFDERPFVDATLRAAEKAIARELPLLSSGEIAILECGGMEPVNARGRAGYRVKVRAWISGEVYEAVGVAKGKGAAKSSIFATLHAIRRICRRHVRKGSGASREALLN